MRASVRICKEAPRQPPGRRNVEPGRITRDLRGFGRRRAGLGTVGRDGMMGTAERRLPMAGGRRPAALRCGVLGLAVLALALAAVGCGGSAGGGKSQGGAAPSASASPKAL